MKPHDVKIASEKRLRSLGVTISEHLPTIEEPAELQPRSAQEVAVRACVLSHVIGIGYDRSGKEILECLAEAGVADGLTPREKEFLSKEKHSEQERAWAAWQAAAVHACAWALSLEEMEPLDEGPETLASHFPPRSGPKLGVTLRPFPEIYAESDLYYRLHWAARQARLQGTYFPSPEIEIQLRRQSLDWIVGLPFGWDDMPTDT